MTPRAKFWLALTLPLWIGPWLAWELATAYFWFARAFVDEVWGGP